MVRTTESILDAPKRFEQYLHVQMPRSLMVRLRYPMEEVRRRMIRAGFVEPQRGIPDTAIHERMSFADVDYVYLYYQRNRNYIYFCI